MLVLVRHGESEANAQHMWCGDNDSPLTQQGAEQARETAYELRDTPFDIAFCSSLQRALITAQIILEENASLSPDSLQPRDELIERSEGDLAGLSREATINKFPRRKWLEWERDYYVAPPGGESLYDLSERVIPFMQSVVVPLLAQGKRVLLVSHRGVMQVIFGFLQQMDEQKVPKIQIENATPYFFIPKKTALQA